MHCSTLLRNLVMEKSVVYWVPYRKARSEFMEVTLEAPITVAL